MSKKVWLIKMFFHNNNESSISKVKHLIGKFKEDNSTKNRSSIKNSLAELNALVEDIQKVILVSSIDKREHFSLLMGRLLFACNFDRALSIVQAVPKRGIRWARVGIVGVILCAIMLFFVMAF